ncbi:hypothetical protein [Burkholderia sp. WTPI3]|uniref:hypothetical protein n=1 Tax=Burkholderia sp. WTPI3 TaxID=2822167 RepID=UPI001F410CAA|nr:hypothetical protein [Burkholderia sp. WTPI3]
MKALLVRLFKRRAEAAPAPAPAVPQKPAGKRKLNGKRKRSMPKGAVRGDINGSLIEQARRARGER